MFLLKQFHLKFITNKQTARLLKILNIFEQYPTRCLKSISSLSNSSARTIFSDMDVIKHTFENSIHLTPSASGYSFSIVDSLQYKEIKTSLLQNEPLFVVIESIFYNKMLSVSALAHQLHLSESTLLRHIHKKRHLFTEYDLTLTISPFDFSGKEINIRQFFHDFYFESDITPHTVFPTPTIKEITASLSEKLEFGECPPISFEDFNYTLYITLTRFYNNKCIEKLPDTLVPLDNKKKSQYEEIMGKAILQHFEKDLNWEEKKYIYLITICKRSVFNAHSEQAFQSVFQPSHQIERWTDRYLKILQSSPEEKATHRLFIRSFFLSTLLKYSLSPILTQHITDVTLFSEQKFPAKYQKNQQFIHETVGKELVLTKRQAEDICAALTLFTDSMLLVYSDYHKKIVFFLEGNRYICENIQANAIKYLGRFHLLFFPNRYDISIVEYFKNNKVDIFVTNYKEYLMDELDVEASLLFEIIPTADNWNELFTVINSRSTQLYSIIETDYE